MELHWIATGRVAELDDKKREGQAKNLTLETFIRELESLPLDIDEFDERLWVVVVDTATVMWDDGLMFHFKDGTEAEA